MLPIIDAAAGIMQGVVKPILDKFVPDAQQRAEAEQLASKQLHDLNLAQVEVNKIEAASSSLFVAGWRPFVGWVCGGTFAYVIVGHDVLNWVLLVTNSITGRAIPPLPSPDGGMVINVLFALLGFGGLRTYEKLSNVAR